MDGVHVPGLPSSFLWLYLFPIHINTQVNKINLGDEDQAEPGQGQRVAVPGNSQTRFNRVSQPAGN